MNRLFHRNLRVVYLHKKHKQSVFYIQFSTLKCTVFMEMGLHFVHLRIFYFTSFLNLIHS